MYTVIDDDKRFYITEEIIDFEGPKQYGRLLVCYEGRKIPIEKHEIDQVIMALLQGKEIIS